MPAAFAETTALKRDIERDWLASTAAERGRRHLVRLLDWAIGVCEEVNLGRRSPQDQALQLACALTEQLEAIAGLEVRRPDDSAAALERLFELQELYLLARAEPDGDGEDSGDEETVDVAAMSDAELARAITVARSTGTPALEAQMESIAAAAGVTLEELRGPSRHREVVELRRQLAVHLRSRGWSLTTIGRLLNRDHSTVVHLLRSRSGPQRAREVLAS
jgi:hypothetical protein